MHFTARDLTSEIHFTKRETEADTENRKEAVTKKKKKLGEKKKERKNKTDRIILNSEKGDRLRNRSQVLQKNNP